MIRRSRGCRHRSVARGLAVLLAAAALAAGCSLGSIAPAYTEEDLALRCLRQRGTWRADPLMGGFCEYRAAQSESPRPLS